MSDLFPLDAFHITYNEYISDIVNIPSWYAHDDTPAVNEMPALLMRHMSVDMQRTYSRVRIVLLYTWTSL